MGKSRAKKSYGQFLGKKNALQQSPTHYLSPLLTAIIHTTAARSRLPLSAAFRCRPLPFPAPSAACLAAIRPQRICPHLPPLAPSPPPPCKVSLWPPMTVCLFKILLQSDDSNEEETRSPLSPIAPKAHRIIGRGAANDIMPFYFIATRQQQ